MKRIVKPLIASRFALLLMCMMVLSFVGLRIAGAAEAGMRHDSEMSVSEEFSQLTEENEQTYQLSSLPVLPEGEVSVNSALLNFVFDRDQRTSGSTAYSLVRVAGRGAAKCQTLTYKFFSGERRLETAPFQSAKSCDYYVYALKCLRL